MYCFIDVIFERLSVLETFFWSYIGFALVITAGLYFSIRSRFYQLKVLIHPLRTIKAVQRSIQGGNGINPFRLYCASVGGMVGLGNIVGVVTAVTLGGPGALLWLWVACMCGMLIKYAEIYLGMKFRLQDAQGRYRGGPMIYLQKAFKNSLLTKIAPASFCILLAIYGVEIYQFTVITDILTDVSHLPRFWVLGGLLLLTLYGGLGGIKRLSSLASALMPPFIIGYIGLCLYVICTHMELLIPTLGGVFTSAFLGHAPVGGFVGSSMMMAMQLGTARAVYSGDLGIGYDSIIQSESKAQDPHIQACLSIFGVATDALICTISILVVLLTGLWQTNTEACHAVSQALDLVVPGGKIFVALLILIAGYTTVIAYLTVGSGAFSWLFPKWGRLLYAFYAAIAFIMFSCLEQGYVMTIMSLSGGMLLLINLAGIWKLRYEIDFD